VPLEIAWRAKCGMRTVGFRPLLYCIVVSTFLGLNDQGCWRALAWRGHCPAYPFKRGQRVRRSLFI